MSYSNSKYVSDDTRYEYLDDIQSKHDFELTFMARSCVENHTGDECSTGYDEEKGYNLLVCRVHCSSDGCNSANDKNVPVFTSFLILSYVLFKI